MHLKKVNNVVGQITFFYSLLLFGDLTNKAINHILYLRQYFLGSFNGKIWLLQFIVGFCFCVSSIGVLKFKNWARKTLILLSLLKIAFLYLFGPHTLLGLKNHIFNFGSIHPIMVANDIFSTLLSFFLLIYLFSPKVKKMFSENRNSNMRGKQKQ